MLNLKKETLFVILVLFSAFILFSHLGLIYADIMESRNFVTAREMVVDNNWLTTTLNGTARYQKPPLPTWLSALMGLIFGTGNLTALRFPVACISLLSVIFLYRLTNRLFNNYKIAFTSGIVLSSSFLFVFMARKGTWDMFCFTFMIIGIYYLYRAISETKQKYLDWVLAGIFIGLSFLSKGPTAIYVMLLPFLMSYTIVFKVNYKNAIIGLCLSGAISVLIGGWWYAYILMVDYDGFMEIMRQESTARVNRNVKPFYRYASFFVQTGVWSIFTLIGLLFPYASKRIQLKKEYKFILFWSLFTLFFLSTVPSKKERYLLPIIFPLAILVAQIVYNFSTQKKSDFKIINRFFYTLISLISFSLPIVVFFLIDKIKFWHITLAISCVTISFLLLHFTYFKKSYYNSFICTASLMLCLVLFGLPIYKQVLFQNKEYKPTYTIKKHLLPDQVLYSYNLYSPELWLSYGNKIPNIETQKAYTFPKENNFLILFFSNEEMDKAVQFFDEKGYSLIYLDFINENWENKGQKNYTHRKDIKLYRAVKN